MGKQKKKAKAKERLQPHHLATLDLPEDTVLSPADRSAIAKVLSLPTSLMSTSVPSRTDLADASLTIQQLQEQILQSHQQLEAQTLEYEQLIEVHAKLQDKSTQQAACLDQLQHRILQLESQLQQLYTASQPQTDLSSIPSPLLLQELTQQVNRLKKQLHAQTEARHHAEEQNRTLSQQIHHQMMMIESLQAQIQTLRSTAQIGETYLNRWQKHQFRG